VIQKYQDHLTYVFTVVDSKEVMESWETCTQFKGAVFGTCNPVGGQSQVTLAPLVCPQICCIRNTPKGTLGIQDMRHVAMQRNNGTRTHHHLLSKTLKVSLPGLDNGLTDLGSMGDIFISKFLVQWEDESQNSRPSTTLID
jgi:hypothetical protein